jgi:predicted enzyme related to lactoylglutathione lyase
VIVIVWRMITRLDHLVLTVSDISKTIAFYVKAFGATEMLGVALCTVPRVYGSG